MIWASEAAPRLAESDSTPAELPDLSPISAKRRFSACTQTSGLEGRLPLLLGHMLNYLLRASTTIPVLSISVPSLKFMRHAAMIGGHR